MSTTALLSLCLSEGEGNGAKLHLNTPSLGTFVTACCLFSFKLFIPPSWPDSQILSVQIFSPQPSSQSSLQTLTGFSNSLFYHFSSLFSRDPGSLTVFSKINVASLFLSFHEDLIIKFLKLFIVPTVWSIFSSGYSEMNHQKLGNGEN